MERNVLEDSVQDLGPSSPLGTPIIVPSATIARLRELPSIFLAPCWAIWGTKHGDTSWRLKFCQGQTGRFMSLTEVAKSQAQRDYACGKHHAAPRPTSTARSLARS